MSGMGSTYQDHFKEKMDTMIEIEARMERDRNNPYLMDEYAKATNRLLFAVMDVVEELADAKGESRKKHPLRMTTEERRAAGIPDDGVTDEIRFAIPTDATGYRAYQAIATRKALENLGRAKEGAEAPVGASISTMQRIIGDWSAKTFPASTIDSTLRHLWTEMVELDRAFTSGKDNDCREEVADLFILLVQLCNRATIDLQQAVIQKHAENLTRRWDAPDKHGVVYHTKESN